MPITKKQLEHKRRELECLNGHSAALDMKRDALAAEIAEAEAVHADPVKSMQAEIEALQAEVKELQSRPAQTFIISQPYPGVPLYPPGRLPMPYDAPPRNWCQSDGRIAMHGNIGVGGAQAYNATA